MLTIKKLREVIAELHDDMPVLIATTEEQADDINSIGIGTVGRRKWSGLIVAGVPDVEGVKVLVVSTLSEDSRTGIEH